MDKVELRLCRFATPAPPGEAARPRAGRGGNYTSNRAGIPTLVGVGAVMRGGALAAQGQAEEGIAQIQQGLAAYRNLGAKTERTAHLPMLAAAYAKVGRVEEGLSALAEALDAVNKTGARVSEAGMYVLKGELTLQQWKVESQKSPIPSSQHLAPKAKPKFHVGWALPTKGCISLRQNRWAGSPKELTPRTYRKRRRCLKN
jgi:hypothetical protein